MQHLNSCVFIGDVYSGPTTQSVGQKGTLLTSFQLVNTVGNEPYQKTNLITVKVWGQYGQELAFNLHVGDTCAVVGELQCSQWNTKVSWDLMARSVTKLSDGSKASQQESVPETDPDPRLVVGVDF